MSSKQRFEIYGSIKPTLEGMDKIVSELKNGLEKGTTKVDLTKGLGGSLSKLMAKYQEQSQKFVSSIKEGVELKDSSQVIKQGENLIKTYSELERIIGNINTLSIKDARSLFPEGFDRKVEDARQALNSYLSAVEKVSKQQLNLNSAKQEVNRLNADIEGLKASTSEGAKFNLNVTDANENLRKTKEEVEKLKTEISESLTLNLSETEKQIKAAEKTKSQIEEKRKNRKSTKDLTVSPTGTVRYKNKTQSEWEKERKKDNYSSQQINGAIDVFNNFNKEEQQYRAATDALKNLYTQRDAQKNALTQFSSAGNDISKITNALQKSNKFIDTAQVKDLSEALADVKKKEEDLKAATGLEDLQSKLDSATQKALEHEKALISIKSSSDFSKVSKAFEDVGIQIDNTALSSEDGINNLKKKLDELDQESFDKLIKELDNIGINSEDSTTSVEKMREALGETADTTEDLKRAAAETESLKNQVLQFFSIGNTIEIFKQAIRSAYDTIKELDSAMTEIAVVSDFSVGDIWNKLPQFTEQANELGVAVRDTYDATALYIQQGLDLQHSMELSTETLKMARIAGMEASAATDAMTTSLRGFNMELNGESAQRIDDVYSKLAAVTASDTQELATAMSKTASLAHSVNMEFETTSAFLAQGIESTRESAETIGTALKTVIARFSEVKDLYSKGEVLGADENGEEINVNNVQKALRSAGIDMTKFLTGGEGLDQVFLRLSEKWDTLDTITQRYL